jgi:hypothetical protein
MRWESSVKPVCDSTSAAIDPIPRSPTSALRPQDVQIT